MAIVFQEVATVEKNSHPTSVGNGIANGPCEFALTQILPAFGRIRQGPTRERPSVRQAFPAAPPAAREIGRSDTFVPIDACSLSYTIEQVTD